MCTVSCYQMMVAEGMPSHEFLSFDETFQRWVMSSVDSAFEVPVSDEDAQAILLAHADKHASLLLSLVDSKDPYQRGAFARLNELRVTIITTRIDKLAQWWNDYGRYLLSRSKKTNLRLVAR